MTTLTDMRAWMRAVTQSWAPAVIPAVFAAVLAVFAATAACAREPSPPASQSSSAVGFWERVDDASGQPAAWFRILDCDGVFQGKMVKIFSAPPGKNPADWRCTSCTGEQKDAPVIGLTFINGMRKNGLAYEGGSILDPRTGSTYGARMDLSPDGKQLSVRGFLGFELFGHTEVWQRLPDNAMPPKQFGSCS